MTATCWYLYQEIAGATYSKGCFEYRDTRLALRFL